MANVTDSMVDIGTIVADEGWNPRVSYSGAAKLSDADIDGGATGAIVEDLARSIKREGLLSPLTVRLVDVDGVSVPHLVAGFRRLRACKMAGVKMVPVRIVDTDERGARLVNLAENFQRKNLLPIEQVFAVASAAKLGLASKEIAASVGLTKGHVENLLRVSRNASAETIGRLRAGEITLTLAIRVCHDASTPETQSEGIAIAKGLQPAGGDSDGSESGNSENAPAEKREPSKASKLSKRLPEIARVLQFAREVKAGRQSGPKGAKYDDRFWVEVVKTLAWVVGEGKPPFPLPTSDE